MKKLAAILLVLPLMLVLASCGGEDLQPRVDELEERLGPPPEFLDRLFPPEAPYPVLLVEMFALGAAFEGIPIDLGEGDFENLPADFEAFETQYNKLRDEIIPEWKDLMPLAPVEELGQAIQSQDPAQIGKALGNVGRNVCGKCHEANQLKVQFKYHWPDHEQVEFTDPLSGEDLEIGDFMRNMVVSFDGIGHALSQGQGDRSLQHYENFTAYFDVLNEGCSQCHDPRRDVLLNPAVEPDIQALGDVLRAPSPDVEALEGLMQGIGGNLCMNCHLVHMPAVQAQERWEHEEEEEE